MDTPVWVKQNKHQTEDEDKRKMELVEDINPVHDVWG
jgi:hypothetical protein